jgi:hypothetical protein
LPPAIEGLRTAAYNLRWCWSHDSVDLFRRLDRDLWEKAGHNPVLLLGTIEQAKLENVAKDDPFLAHLRRVESNLETYLAGDSTWFRRTYAKSDDEPFIAYFSAEFGLTECLSIFAGGLGILAGDHLKSASDLGVPLVGVGHVGSFHAWTDLLGGSVSRRIGSSKVGLVTAESGGNLSSVSATRQVRKRTAEPAAQAYPKSLNLPGNDKERFADLLPGSRVRPGLADDSDFLLSSSSWRRNLG